MNDKQDFKVLRLEKDNYVVWKWQFVNILKVKKLEKVLDKDYKLDAEIDMQALALLGSALNEENMLKIINCDNFKDAWLALQRCFENKTSYEPQNLFRRLNSYKINSASEVSQGISEMRGIVATLRNLKETVSDNCLIGAILSALPSSFEIFITVWKNSSDQNVDNLISKVMAEASDQADKESKDTKALAATKNVNKKFKKSSVDKDQCRYCKETGHWIKDCPNLKTPYDPNKNKNRRNKKGDDDKKNDNAYDFACMTNSSQSMISDEVWVADSGCTNHMTPHKHLFNSFTRSSSIGVIRLANDNLSLNVQGQGEIVTERCRLKDVLYVPGLSQNLFSVSAAASNGLTHVGSKDKIMFMHKDREVFAANLINKLYLINLKAKNPLEAHVKSATINEWHARFNHVSPDTIKLMHKNDVVSGLDIVAKKDEKCQDCQMNKCTRTSHPLRTTSKATKPGNVLHVDTSGKSNVSSRGGSQYFVLCKDEASKYRQVAFVTTKDQIPNKVKEFISRAMLETGNPVLKLVSDNGSEFTNNDLSKFLQNRGIIHECSVPYVAQQNGFVEREIRTLKETAKTMLSNSKMNKNLWAEAINCAAYTLNRVINSANANITPYEMWHRAKPNVKNLRIFGELAILKKQDSQVKGTWDEKGTKAIFVGYTERFNTYKFIDGPKIVIACDAVFLNKMHNNEEIDERQREDEFWVSGASFDDGISDEVDVQRDQSFDTAGGDMQDISTLNESATIEQEQEPRSSTPLQRNVHFSLDEQDAPEVPRRNQSQAVQEQRPQEAQQSSNRELQPTISGYFGTNDDLQFTITQNQVTDQFKLSDLEYRQAANNWINKRTGHFIKKDFIKQIKERIQQEQRRGQANVAQVMLVSHVIPIPESYDDAVNSPHHQGWKSAMDDEMNSLIKNEVFEVVPNDSIDKKPVSSRWVFVVKYKQNGELEKFKARIVARGFSQIYGIDYTETYCSVVQIMTTRLILAYAAKMKLAVKQFDVKTAFLYGELNEEIYMEPPDGYGQEGTVWKLKRSLYGLKQSPRMWNAKFTSFMKGLNFRMSNYDNSVFFKSNPHVIVIVYVDDGLIFARQESDVDEILEQLKNRFEIRKLDVNIYRGLEIMIQDDGIFVHQANYTKKILKEFNMSQANPAENPVIKVEESNEPLCSDVPYRQAVGSLMYLADTSRLDISFAVNKLARKMSSPTESDWKQVKHLFRYLNGTVNLGIKFPSKSLMRDTALIGYSDSDFAGDRASSRSTTGFVIMFNGVPFHWKTQLQRHVTLSSTEAEVIALCSLSKELSWIRRMAIELQLVKDEPATIKCDNQSALRIAESERMTARTRHLRAQNDYVYEQIVSAELIIQHVKSANQLADLLTKCVQTGKFIANRNMLLSTNVNAKVSSFNVKLTPMLS